MYDTSDPDNPVKIEHKDNPLVNENTIVLNAIDGGRVCPLPSDREGVEDAQ